MYDRGQIMTEDERIEIIDWLCRSYFSMYIISPSVVRPTPGRLRKQLSALDNDVPMAIWRIRQRIVDKEGLSGYITEPLMRDLISIMLPGGKIHPHKDVNVGDFIHSRFNVFLQVPPDDFKTYYGGKRVEAVQGHYTLCRSGQDVHWSDALTGKVPRITISFGFLIPKAVLERMYYPPFVRGMTPASPSPLEVENVRADVAVNVFGGVGWYSGDFGKIINAD